MAITARLFRVFVSSTFNDFTLERNALQAEVYPRLQEFCRRHGARFQAVDLRWGVSEEAGRDQQTLDVCLEEIRRCQRTTARPNFIALLGSRYGWRPLPPRIPADEFHALLAVLPTQGRDALGHWYWRDDNALPLHYKLQPIPDQATWERADRELRAALREAVAAQGWSRDDPRRLKYETSATHQEILHGLLQPPAGGTAPCEHVCCYLRKLDLLQRVPRTSPVRFFGDYLPDPDSGDLVRDADAADRLERLKGQIRAALPSEQVHDYPGRWSERGVELDLAAFCRRVETDLTRQIAVELQRQGQLSTRPGGEEARAHRVFAAERAQGFVGRRDALDRIAAYLADAGSREPLLIRGPSGAGKTALLARAAQQVGAGSLVLERYLGVTPAASTLRGLLTQLCQELGAHAGSPAAPTTDLQELTAEWSRLLGLAAAARPVVLFLDSLDQLSGEDQAHTLSWLPRPLPPGVRLVASVLEADGEAGACGRAAAPLIPAAQQLPLGPLPEGEAAELLAGWLREAGRTLQVDQQAAVARRLTHCRLPLYLRGLFQEVRRWASYDKLPREPAADTAGLLHQLFNRLEERRHHSPILVGHALGYLAAGRHGLAEDELLDVLAADPGVMQDFHEYSPTERSKPPAERLSRLPPVLWSRLRFDLEDYLAEREADGATVLAFYHREIGEVVRVRCCRGPDRLERHRGLARYFGGRSLEQPGTASGRLFNLRKLAELPYQQTEGELWPELQGLLAGDFTFLRAKTEAGQVFDLVGDYDRAKPGLSGVPALGPWYHFVRGQGHALAARPELFFQQAFNEPTGSPVSEAARQRLGGAEEPERWLEWLNRPREFVPPPCVQVLAGHTWQVNGVALTADGRTAVSASHDLTVRVWDLQTGNCRLTLGGHTDWVNGVALTPDGRTAVSGSQDGTVRVWDLSTGRCVAVLRGHTEAVGGVALTPDGGTAVSASWDDTLRVWDLRTGTCRATLAGHTGDVVTVAVTPDGRTALSGGRDKTLRVWDLAAGRCGAVLRGQPSMVTSVAVTPDGRTAVSGSSDYTARVWDLQTGECRATLEGHTGIVDGVALTADGRTALTGSWDTTIRVWDLPTGEHRATLEGHTRAVFSVAVTPDGTAAVSGARDDTVRVWDLRAANRRAPPEGHTAAVPSVAITPDGGTAVTGSRDRTVRVWDPQTGCCRATLQGHLNVVSSVVVSADGRIAVSVSYDNTVRVWDLRTGTCLAVYRKDDPACRQAWADIREEPGQAACVTKGQFLTLQATPSGEVLARFPGLFEAAGCSAEGRYVVAGTGAGQVYFFRLRSRGG